MTRARLPGTHRGPGTRRCLHAGCGVVPRGTLYCMAHRGNASLEAAMTNLVEAATALEVGSLAEARTAVDSALAHIARALGAP